MLRDRSLWNFDDSNPNEVTITVDEPVPTPEEIKLLRTKQLPKGLLAIDNCGAGSQEYRHNDPLAIWKNFPVGYYLTNSVPSILRTGVANSFDVYNQLRPDFFKVHQDSSTAKIQVSMGDLGSRGGTLARATWTYFTSSLSLSKGTITFDTNESWAWLDRESCGSTGSIYDIGNVAVHEIGHLVGLAHAPTDVLQTMYATTSPGKTLGRTLGNGDKLGITKAYNITEPVPAPTPEKDYSVLIAEMYDILNDATEVLDQMKRL